MKVFGNYETLIKDVRFIALESHRGASHVAWTVIVGQPVPSFPVIFSICQAFPEIANLGMH